MQQDLIFLLNLKRENQVIVYPGKKSFKTICTPVVEIKKIWLIYFKKY